MESPVSRGASSASVGSLDVEPSLANSPVFPVPDMSYEAWAHARWLARHQGDWSSPSSSARVSDEGSSLSSPPSYSAAYSVVSLPPLGLPMEE